MLAAIIGTGRMGRRIMQSSILNGFINFIAYEKSTEARSLTKQEFGERVNFSQNLEELWNAKPDLLIVATTADFHLEFLKQGILNNIPYILCEKPVVRSTKEYNEIKALKGNSKIAVNHQMRFLPQYTKVLELQTEYQLGEISSILFNAGNFGLANNGTHYIEAARFICKSKPETIVSFLDKEIIPNPRGTQFEDKSGIIKIKMESKAEVIINAKSNAGHGCTAHYIFRNGFIFIDELTGMLYLNCRKPEFLNEPTTRYGMPNITKTLQIEPVDIIQSTADVIKALLLGLDFPSFEEGYIACKAIMAGFSSNEKIINFNTFECNDEFKWA